MNHSLTENPFSSKCLQAMTSREKMSNAQPSIVDEERERAKNQATANLATFREQNPEKAAQLPSPEQFIHPSIDFAFDVKVSHPGTAHTFVVQLAQLAVGTNFSRISREAKCLHKQNHCF